MNQPLLHVTKREWQRLCRARGLWIGMAAAGVILGLLGPFGTDDALAALPRLLYWLAVVALTFSTGYLISAALTTWAAARGVPIWAALTLGALVSSAAITAEIVGLNAALFADWPRQTGLARLALTITAIVAILTVATYLIDRAPENPAVTPADLPRPPGPADPPRLLQRLPVETRAPLVALSVTDHYVHVTTTRGTDMLLMRLSDAILETEPTDGIRIHRSHWVASDAIAGVQRTGAKTEVVLRTGARLPVARSAVSRLKQAGFMPKSTA